MSNSFWQRWRVKHIQIPGGHYAEFATFGVSEIDIINWCESHGFVIITTWSTMSAPPITAFLKIEDLAEHLLTTIATTPAAVALEILLTNNPKAGTW